MIRLRASRLMQALMAMVWCGAVAARPFALPCPMAGHGMAGHAAHGAPHASSAVVSHESDVSMDMSIDMSMAGNASLDPQATDKPVSLPTPGAPTDHPCDCLAHCCAPVAAVPSRYAPTITTVEYVVRRAVFAARASFVSSWSDFVLPFAMAPPVSA